MAQETKIDYNLLIIAGIGIGAFFMGKKLLQALGLTEDKSDVAAQQMASQPFWSTTGIKTPRKALIWKESSALAKSIKDAAGLVNDNEEQIFAAFRQLRFQSQVADIVGAFNTLYKQDLYYWLKDVLSQSELLEINSIISTKPKGY